MSLEDNLKRGFEAFGRGDMQTAADLARSAIQESPQNPGALTLTGRLALTSQRLDVAYNIFSKMTEHPCPAEVWVDLARTLVALRRDEEAAQAARGAAALDQNLKDAHLILGEILLSLNDKTGAAEAYRRVLALDFAETQAYIGLARVADLAVGGPEVTRLLSLVKEPRLPKTRIADAHYALSFVYKRVGDDKKFIEHMFAANAAQKAARPGSRKFYEETFDRLEEGFERARVLKAVGADNAQPAPIFILGMPRSGTTLVEQILSGNPQVAAGGELNFSRVGLAPATEKLTGKPFPLGWEELGAQKMVNLARPFTNNLIMIAQGKPFVTDKTPGNYHILAMLVLLFPNSKVISVRRDPMDTAFSMLQQPFDERSPHTYDIDLMAYSYSRYQRMMGMWDAMLSHRMHIVQYEDLVRNPEAEGKKLLEACGLTWDPKYLNFHTQNRAVHTFSTQQVRNAINTSSIGAWKKYEKDLAPLKRAMIAEKVIPA